MDEYTDLDMLKSLVKTVELLAEENKELRKEVKELLGGVRYCVQLTDEQRQRLEVFFRGDSDALKKANLTNEMR